MISKYDDFSDKLVDRCVKALDRDLDRLETFNRALEWVEGAEGEELAAIEGFSRRSRDENIEFLTDEIARAKHRYETRLEFASEVLGIHKADLEHAVRP